MDPAECCEDNYYYCNNTSGCVPNSDPCCNPDQTQCDVNGALECRDDPNCCDTDEHYCPDAINSVSNGQGDCRSLTEPCCNEYFDGEEYCPGENACIVTDIVEDGVLVGTRPCCDHNHFYCDLTSQCEPDGFDCTPPEVCPYDPTMLITDPRCCDESQSLEWCESRQDCRIIDDCCPNDGERRCRLPDGDETCYTEQDCCDYEGGFWCYHNEQCSTEQECCDSEMDLDG